MAQGERETAPFWVALLQKGKGRFAGAIVMVLCVLAFLATHEKGLWPDLRLGLFDSYQKAFPRDRKTAPVTIVAIDEASLKAYGQWPWSRDLMAQLLLNTRDLEPIAMGFDIIMAESDRFSPSNLPFFRRAPNEIKQWFQEQASTDEVLASAIAQIPMAMGIAGLEEGPLNPTAALAPSEENGFDAKPWLRTYVSELRSLPLLENQAWGHGLLSVDPDEDGIVRRIPLVALLGERIAPSLDLEVLRLAVGANWFSLNGTDKGISSVQVGGLEIPTQKNGALWIHYTASDPSRFVSARDVLEGNADPYLFRDKLVLFGVTGLGLIDYPATPVAARMSGVEVRAQLLENIFDQNILSRPNWALGFELGVLLAFAGAALVAVPQVLPKVSLFIWAGLSWGSIGAGFVFFKEALVLIDPVTPALSGSLVFLTVLSSVLVEKDRQNKIYQRDLERQRQKEAKLAGELDAAKRIQMGILPDTAKIKDPRLEICAFLEPAKDVGGDLYDVFMIDEDHLFFMVGDVAGKGIPASLFMALGKSLYKSSVLRGQNDIAVIMSEANAEISRDNPEMLFITAFAGILNLKTGLLNYCNAGHDAPHLFKREGKFSHLEGVGGPPLCILDEMDYPGETMQLEPGHSILIITDGVSEAMNQSGELFGTARLDDYIRSIDKSKTAPEMVDGLYRQVKTYANGAEPSDDITILALSWQA